MELPKKYEFLSAEPGPRMLVTALRFYGVAEEPGSKNNPIIMGWAKELGLERTFYGDIVPWCGLFAALVARRSGWADHVPETPLWARSWAEFGDPADVPSLGDVLVFARDGGGHVGFYVGEDAKHYHVLGGNQSNEVNITRIEKPRLLAARQPKWRVAVPANRRPVPLSATGPVSKNEA